MPLNDGQVINNRYRIVKLLGQGGFGAVYRAYDLHLKTPCALKENLETSPAAQRQFEREATILAGLSHPNLPRVTDHFVIPGQGQYLVMDFIEGQDLHTLVDSSGALPESQVLGWANQVLDALEYLHHLTPPILHRDIKPANLRIRPASPSRPQGSVTLVDFGLVKRAERMAQTTTGALAVSPGYSPPEQYGQGITDPRSDIYALGAALYTALTGLPPQESVLRVARDELRPAHLVNPRVSTRTSFALQKAMALSADARFRSAAEFRQALNAPPSSQPAPAGFQSVPRQTATAGNSVARPASSSPLIAPPAPISAPVKPSLVKTLAWPVLIGGVIAFLLTAIVVVVVVLRLTGQPTEISDAQQASEAISTDTTRPSATFPAIATQLDLPTATAWPTLESPTLAATLEPSAVPPAATPIIGAGGIPSYDLAFASNRLGDFGVVLFNTLSSQSLPLAHPSGYELAWWPSFCGNQVAAEVQDFGGGQPQWIGMLNASGTAASLWDPPDAFDLLGVPRCSHNSQYITYSGNAGNGWHLYFAYLDGRDTFILDDDGIAGYGSWTSSDTYLYYTIIYGAGSSEIRDIWNLPDATSPAAVIEGKYPAISPDDSTLAYMCNPVDADRYDHLCTVHLPNGGNTVLRAIEYIDVDYDHDSATSDLVPASPAWSADGQWIYFPSAEDGDWDIYRIHPDGTGLQNLTGAWDSQELMPATQW
jgi:serine/threonine protein kinase